MDMMLAAGAQLLSITAALWVMTELIGRGTGWNKAWIALALGPTLGIGAYATGFLSALPECPPVIVGCKWWAAGFAGLISTLVGKGFHDLIGNRIVSAVTKPPQPPTVSGDE